MGRWAAGNALIGTFAGVVAFAACSSGSTSTLVDANGESKTVPCPGSGCVGGYVFICDSDGNVNSYGRCSDGGVDAGVADGSADVVDGNASDANQGR